MKYLIITILAVISTFLLSCSSPFDYSGTFMKGSGKCTYDYINLKKVQGFADKYYLVRIYKKGQTIKDGKEFLAVVKNNILTIDSGKITVSTGSIRAIDAKGNSCVYNRISRY